MKRLTVFAVLLFSCRAAQQHGVTIARAGKASARVLVTTAGVAIKGTACTSRTDHRSGAVIAARLRAFGAAARCLRLRRVVGCSARCRAHGLRSHLHFSPFA